MFVFFFNHRVAGRHNNPSKVFLNKHVDIIKERTRRESLQHNLVLQVLRMKRLVIYALVALTNSRQTITKNWYSFPFRPLFFFFYWIAWTEGGASLLTWFFLYLVTLHIFDYLSDVSFLSPAHCSLFFHLSERAAEATCQGRGYTSVLCFFRFLSLTFTAANPSRSFPPSKKRIC